MKKTFMMPVVCSLLAASMMLSGCSAVSNGDNAVGETSKPTEIKSIGLMVQDMSNPFFSAMDREAKVQAKKIGATLNVQDAQLDLTTQDNQISAFIEQGVDLIIVSAVDESGLKPAIERARAAGIIRDDGWCPGWRAFLRIPCQSIGWQGQYPHRRWHPYPDHYGSN